MTASEMSGGLSAAEAAARLGVKPATLYAYVSRGLLTRRAGPDGRTSRFDAAEIELLARRGRPRRPAGAADITVESAITQIGPGWLRYRGYDAVELALTRPFEDVAELLWSGEPGHGGPWRATDVALITGRAAQQALPADILPLERFAVIVAAMAATDPLRLSLEPPSVRAAGRAIIAGLIDCLRGPDSLPGPDPDSAGGIADRLWLKLCERRATPALLRALSAALVLLADHELAASTLAARAAASVRADPYAVVATGLGAVSGALHGGSSLGAEALLTAARRPADVPKAVGELLRRGERVPGFGHLIYKGGDPRAVALLDLVRAAAPKSAQLAVADAVIAEVRRKSLPEPNVDFALATLARVAGMIRGAGEAIFAVARAAGWVGHALEAYHTVPIRPRAVYTGPVREG